MKHEEKQIKCTATYDKKARAGYIHLSKNEDEKAEESIPVINSSIVLDINEDNELIGIEILNPDQLPTKIKDKIDL